MTTVTNTDSKVWSDEFREYLRQEIAVGGELTKLPCPFCKLPRCQRSSYIRCSKCGMNWDHGTDYSRHPSFSYPPTPMNLGGK